ILGLGSGTSNCCGFLSSCNNRVGRRPLHRSGRCVEGPGLPRTRGMMVAEESRGKEAGRANVEQWSGKNRGDENFPVGSLLVAKKYRGPIHRFYTFARNADDISDSPDLPAEAKI